MANFAPHQLGILRRFAEGDRSGAELREVMVPLKTCGERAARYSVGCSRCYEEKRIWQVVLSCRLQKTWPIRRTPLKRYN